jgi:hypothetical protein
MSVDHSNSSFKKSVFISHASKNFKLADEIREMLESTGVSCWIAPREIPPGYQYGTAIVEAVRDCTITLLLLTDEANKSKAVENEIERAFGYQKVIVPLRIREVKPATGLEFFISNAQWVDAIVSPLKSRIDQIVNIVHAIEMNKPAPTPTPEKRTFVGTAERYLEKLLRHKMISAVSAFLILTAIGGIGIYMQSKAHIDLAGIEKKNDKVKLETSADPRKELANRGILWNTDSFLQAANTNDLETVGLFMDGKMPLTGVTAIFKDFLAHKQTIELMRSKGVDFITDFAPGNAGNGGGPLWMSSVYKNFDAIDWLLKIIAMRHLTCMVSY